MQETIRLIIERAQKNRTLYEKSEAAVRDHIINPILGMLGWHVDDPDFVIPNLPSDEGGIPDYTLKKDGRIVTFIEAKNLSANLNDHIKQLATYCYNHGTEFGILTNGLQWMLLKTFEKGTNLSDRIVWQSDIQKDDYAIIAKRLALISYDNMAGLAEKVEKDKMLQLVWNTFLISPDSLLGLLVSVFADNVKTNYPAVTFDIEEVREFFERKLKDLITGKPKEVQDIDFTGVDDSARLSYNSKAHSPSASEWRRRVPELAKVQHLNTWKAICSYLKIEVAGDSARRRLKEWATKNKPKWPEVPSPQ